MAKYSFSIERDLELDRQPAVGLVVPGHEDRAAGVAVQPMHDARPQRPAAAAEAGAKVELQAR